MKSQNHHEILTQLYLELGLLLPDALRAAEADLKNSSPPSYSASEMSSEAALRIEETSIC
jgi:hypothetical protein